MVATGMRFVAVPCDRRCPWSTRLTSLSLYDLSRSASDTADARALSAKHVAPSFPAPSFSRALSSCVGADRPPQTISLASFLPCSKGWGLNVGIMPIGLIYSLRS